MGNYDHDDDEEFEYDPREDMEMIFTDEDELNEQYES